jgi:hypothetical protein
MRIGSGRFARALSHRWSRRISLFHDKISLFRNNREIISKPLISCHKNILEAPLSSEKQEKKK